MTRVFFDTNILVYILSAEDPNKAAQADSLITSHFNEGAISLQVVQEYANVTLKKSLLSPEQLQAVMEDLLQPLCQHAPSFKFYGQALELFDKHSLSFYDALIVQAALDLDCETLYSEDLQHGQRFGRLQICNPFLSGQAA